ncbi:GTP-binding protein [Neorhodopirellula lusitana]|uniref:GTP-binding protein n=1 Tax=Neorhodopirellula lusitana TaxID=445327 RepID=UPI00384F1192
MNDPIEFIMIGGFLGAGKTTLIANLAKRFQAQGKHVCVVTNDQAAGLVDTELLKSQGLEVNEVAGSCFCCNFDGLTNAMDEFETRRRPDVILAEPVGSCTDLIATIALPMMERLGGKFIHRPYAVVLKPSHGKKILSGVGGGFSEKAEYIFHKQLEESEIILVNRIDELSSADVQQLESQLAEQYPGRRVICLSAKTGENLDALFEAFQTEASVRDTTMDVDYDVYADGEAELGWLNATVEFVTEDANGNGFSLDQLATGLVEQLRLSLGERDAETGHLKVLCSSGSDVSVANLIDSESPTMLSVSSEVMSKQAKAIINARVRMAPKELTKQVNAAVSAVAEKLGTTASTQQLDSFRPGRPTPTHRSSL